MSDLGPKISWYQSLAFKLFVIVSLLLFFSISTISLQNGKTFKGILNRQNEDNLLSSNQRAASSFQESSLFWLSLGNAVVHMSSRGGETALRDAAEGILASNRGLASVQILEGGTELTQTLFRFTKIAVPELQDKDVNQIALAMEKAGKDQVAEEDQKPSSTMFLHKAPESVKAPILILATKLVRTASSVGEGGEEGATKPKDTWIVLGVWSSALAGGLQRSETFASAILDFKGTAILKSLGDESKGLLIPVKEAELKSVTKGSVQFRTWSTTTEKQEPVMVTATRLGDFPLIAVSQKMSKQDDLEISRQVRQILLWTWILFLVAVGVTYFAAGSVTKRILALLNSTMEIAAGNFHTRLAVNSKDEVGHLSAAVNKMAEDIENLMQMREEAVRQQSELKMAEQIQQTLIPSRVVERNGLKSVSYFKPATECAGDWWGRFSLGGGLELVVMADATGHGVHSALIAAMAHSYFATMEDKIAKGSPLGISPNEILSGLNAVMFGAGKGVSTMTACILLFDMNSQRLYCANAGHCLPFTVVNSDTKTIALAGNVIGSEEVIAFEEKVIHLKPGQRFLIYTDGLFECENAKKELIKKRQLKSYLGEHFSQPIEEFSQSLFSEIDHFFGKHKTEDDITMVVLEVSFSESEAAQ